LLFSHFVLAARTGCSDKGKNSFEIKRQSASKGVRHSFNYSRSEEPTPHSFLSTKRTDPTPNRCPIPASSQWRGSMELKMKWRWKWKWNGSSVIMALPLAAAFCAFQPQQANWVQVISINPPGS